MASIKIILRTSKINAAGEAPLCLRLIKNRKAKFVYDKLVNSPTLLNSNTLLQNFYNANTSSPVGELQGVKTDINALDNIDTYFATASQVMQDALSALKDSISKLDSLMLGDSLNAENYIVSKKSLREQSMNLQNSIALLKYQSGIQLSSSFFSFKNAA